MPQTKKALVLFSPSGKRGRFPMGTPVLQAARELGVDIDSICGGRACCGRCQVDLVEGTFAKEAMISRLSHLSELSATEHQSLKTGQLKAGRRLSCQLKILGDVKIDVPAESQIHQQVVRKDYEDHPVELDPVVRLYFTEVAKPDLEHPSGDLQRLEQALQRDWGLSGLDIDLHVMQTLQAALHNGGGQVTVAVRDEKSIVAIWADFRDRVYGAAIDVGSTTIAVHLCNLATGEVLASAGAMNPQIRFGEDLMSRVSYAMINPDGATQMTGAVRSAINDLILSVTEQADIDADQVLELTVAGNPIMHHLLLGLDPIPLGSAPFSLATDQAVEVAGRALDLQMAEGTRAYTLPCIAGHIGADTSAVLLAESPWDREEISLIIDVGTNAEIILGNRDKLLVASSPTGPAFEGAQINHGQRAAPGAIERVRIDPETLEPCIKVIGGKLWSNEAGFEDELPEQGVTGICGSGIIEAIACMYLTGIIKPDGVIDGQMAKHSSRIEASGRTFSYLLHAGQTEIRIHQSDVRAIQLAKAALYAGARLLMDRLGVEKVDRIRLAGAFGSHIDVKYAMVLGMIPDCDLEQVSSAGNAAGTGARIALLSKAARGEIEKRVLDVERVETAIDESFQRHFVDALAIPHATQEFPMLRRIVTLPASSSKSANCNQRSVNRKK